MGNWKAHRKVTLKARLGVILAVLNAACIFLIANRLSPF
jgi:hypothetical protein